MVAADTDRNPDVSLFDFLARRARRSSDARLVVDAVVGFVVAIAALLAQSAAWHLFASAGICFLSFGVWGMADRELGERNPAVSGTRWLTTARVISTITGFLGAAALFIGTLGIIIGRVIS